MSGRSGMHCRTCCVTFGSLSAFDVHLRGVLRGGAHLAPASAGLVAHSRAGRTVWRLQGAPGRTYPWKVPRAATGASNG